MLKLIKKRFSTTITGSAYEEMKLLFQTGTVMEYMHKFELIQARLQVDFPYLPQSHYVTTFVSELRDDIKHLVLAKYPTELLEAFEMAKHMEIVLDYHVKRNIPVHKPPIVPTIPLSKPFTAKEKLVKPKPVNSNFPPKNVLIEQRRALGLCFKYG
jgi:hypothetical protein